MTDFKFTTSIDVDLIDTMGTDKRIVAAAKVSTAGDKATDEDNEGLINFLLKNRHGSPFEHGVMTFRVSAPIFVWREHHRHRIASYNEESGRYKELEPRFYVPDTERALIQEGKPGHYNYVLGSEMQYNITLQSIVEASTKAYRQYKELLDLGIAREVARVVLPLNIYSTCYVTMNLRALMNFISLRTKDEKSFFPSYPQREIEMLAEKYEWNFELMFPQTYAAFHNNGRVSP